MPFDGLHVIAFESRRAPEIAELIRRNGGDPFVAPSMREVALEDKQAAFSFAEKLLAGEFDMVVFLTGVGLRALWLLLDGRYTAGRFFEALKNVTVVARGPKPAAVLREMGLRNFISVPEPNTWREILASLDGRSERRIAIQEYGIPSPELVDGLKQRGAEVTTVSVYRWELPEDTLPLREAVHRLARDEGDVVIFTSSAQAAHLLRIANEEGLAGNVLRRLRQIVVASIGPITTETLEELGIHPDFQPSHPKMGLLVQESAARALDILASKTVTRPSRHPQR